jgi:predicted  nucleic acid-binding Zn-ribbon protein
MTVDNAENEEIRALKARISSLESENASLRDDIAELEREMEYISRAKHTKRKKWDADKRD